MFDDSAAETSGADERDQWVTETGLSSSLRDFFWPLRGSALLLLCGRTSFSIFVEEANNIINVSTTILQISEKG